MKKLENDLSKETNEVKNQKKKIEQKEIDNFFKNNSNPSEGISNNTSDASLQLKKYRAKKPFKLKLIVCSIVLALLILLAILLGFGIWGLVSQKVLPHISVKGIDVSNLSIEDATIRLNNELQDDFNHELVFVSGGYTYTITADSIGTTYDIEKSVADAYGVGRNQNNIFTNNIDALKAILLKKDIKPAIKFNENMLNEKIDEIDESMPNKVVKSNYAIDGNQLVIHSGLDGNRVKREKLKDAIYNALESGNFTIEIPTEPYHTDEIDIDAIYKDIYKKPVDAVFVADPYEIRKEENGLDFDISLNEARAMVADRQDTYTIPLKVLYPNVTVSSLPQEAFPDELSTYSTTYATSNYNRSTNISIAARTVDGIVLMPGETFSYNETLGQRTTAKGYKEAGAYLNGQVTSEVGGGICQVSSTLYNAALLCNLEIVDRKNHSFEPSYVPAGQDATVSWKSPDFKFKNNRSYPIKLSATTGGGRITFKIYGMKTSDDYEVKIESSKTSSIPFTTQYVNDSSLPVGTTQILQYGSNGCRSVTYKILYKDGQEVSRTLINSDTYNPHNQVVAKGTQVVEIPVESPSEPVEESGQNEPAVTVTTE